MQINTWICRFMGFQICALSLLPDLVLWNASLIVLFLLAIVLFVPRFTDSDYTFGIFKLFLQKNMLCRGKIYTHKTHTKLLNFQSWNRNINKMRRGKKEWQLLMWKNTKFSYLSEKFIIIKVTDKSHVISVRSHNRCPHKVKFIG